MGREIAVQVGPRQQLSINSERNLTELGWGRKLLRKKLVTKESHIRHDDKLIRRSLGLRTVRAALLDQVLRINSTLAAGDSINDKFFSFFDKDSGNPRPETLIREREALFAEAHERDELFVQYLNQGTVTVDLPELGKQSVRYTRVEPTKIQETDATKVKPPIFIIPGFNNDLDSVGNLMQEMALRGRSVIAVNLPESFMGQITSEYAEAVKNSQTFEHHKTFYKAVIGALLQGTPEFELWGYSMGATIVAELLNDADLQNRVTNSVLLNPSSTVDQSVLQQGIGVLKDMVRMRRYLPALGKFAWISGRNPHEVQETKAAKKVKSELNSALAKRTRTKSDAWKGAKVKDGGSIIVVSGDKDGITKSYKADEMLLENEQIRILHWPGASHLTVLSQPEVILPDIFALQDTSSEH